MQWSQLKKQLESRFAKGVAARVALHQTRYRHSHDQEGEFWITLDKNRIFSSGSLSYLTSLSALTAKHRGEGDTTAHAYKRAWPILDASGLFLLEQINKDLFLSLSLGIDEMLASTSPVVRALALIDSRFGKRRLAAFDPASEHLLIEGLYCLRCDVEGVVRRAPAPCSMQNPGGTSQATSDGL